MNTTVLDYHVIERRVLELIAVESAVFQVYGGLYDSVPWGDAEFLFRLPKKNSYSLGVEIGHDLVGFSIAYEYSPALAHISRVAVHPDRVGEGLGKELLNRQFEVMRHHGCKRCSVDLVRKNTRALSFYRELGFCLLEGDSLSEYVAQKERKSTEYLLPNYSHVAMIVEL